MIKSSIYSRSLLLSVPLFIINYILILFSKYWNNNLSLKNIDLFYFGNIALLLPTIAVVIGLIILNYYYREKSKLFKYTIFILALIAISFSLAIVLIHFFKIEIIGDYIFSYPAYKIILGSLFISNFLILIYTNSIIWLRIFHENEIALLQGIIVTILVTAFLLLFSLIYTTSYYDKELKSDNYEFGFVLGAAVWSNDQPSPIFKRRIDKAYEIYSQGIIKKIHFTGSNAPGELTEAEAALKYLMDNHKIPSSDVIIETSTTTTSEQLKYLRDYLAKKNEKLEVLIISDQFHLMRVIEMAKFYGVYAEGISSGYKLSVEKLLYYRLRDSIGLLIFWFFAI